MVQQINRLAMSWPVVIASLLGFSLYGVALLWPATWWLDVRSVHVSDGPEPQVLAVDRTIVRSFSGRYDAAIYRWTDGGWETVCGASKNRLYRAGAQLPQNLTIDWWTDGQCKGATTKPGRYYMVTRWVIDGGPLPDKSTQAISNIWTVN